MAITIYGYINHADDLEDLSDQFDKLLYFHCEQIFGESPFNRDSYAGLDFLLNKAKPGDIITVATLNQLGRTVAQVIAHLRECLSLDVKVHVIDIAMIDGSEQGKLIAKTLKSIAKL